jgi:hypothetical protein
LSAQFEHTVLVTKDGVEILTLPANVSHVGEVVTQSCGISTIIITNSNLDFHSSFVFSKGIHSGPGSSFLMESKSLCL